MAIMISMSWNQLLGPPHVHHINALWDSLMQVRIEIQEEEEEELFKPLHLTYLSSILNSSEGFIKAIAISDFINYWSVTHAVI